MGKLIKIMEDEDIQNQIDRIADIYEQLRTGCNLEETINNEDILPLVKYLDSINDATLWYYMWAVFLISKRYEHLIEYCENTLYTIKESANQDSISKSYNFLLNYLFKYAPEKRDRLLQDFLNANDISLKFTAAEELTNTDLTKGLIAMLDVYEDAINSYYHDIVDAIELWIYEKANAEIVKELDKRINLTHDKILEEKYRQWKQNIDFA
ncbi:MAG: hypothetical protein GX231_09500 [Tissierellia bacterium]|nr:hypothetical protein [Tissierellia bacterium]